MRRNTSGPYVNWSAEITVAESERFKSVFDFYGARTWGIETALESFLQHVETSSDLQEWARREIENSMYNARDSTPIGRFKYSMKLRTDLYTRFIKLFPAKGAATWFIRRAIHSLALEAERRQFTMGQLVQDSMQVFFQ